MVRASSENGGGNAEELLTGSIAAVAAERTAVDLGIHGRQALLSGASRGLGKACAFALAREGVDVTLVARTPEALASKPAAEIAAETGVRRQHGGGRRDDPAGTGDARSPRARPDILVNNADGPPPGPISSDSVRAPRGPPHSTRMMLAPIEMMRCYSSTG